LGAADYVVHAVGADVSVRLLLITLYPMFTNWGLLDTRLGLMISYIVFALPVATYMLYSYFSQVPTS
jgi:ABC-type glycerol-3-phosphate transport system permease component